MRRMLFVIAAASLLVGSSPNVEAGLVPRLLYGKRIAGTVLDEDTSKPIPGAHVALIWRSGIIPSAITGHNSRDICYHAAATTTDARGHFDIPGWHKWSTYDVYLVEPTVLVYARGYAPVQQRIPRAPMRDPQEHLDQSYSIQIFKGSVDERLRSLFRGLANQGCDFGGESQKSLFPMLRSIYDEARTIASNPEQPLVRAFAKQAAYAALALDPLGPSQDARIDAFIAEHFK